MHSHVFSTKINACFTVKVSEKLTLSTVIHSLEYINDEIKIIKLKLKEKQKLGLHNAVQVLNWFLEFNKITKLNQLKAENNTYWIETENCISLNGDSCLYDWHRLVCVIYESRLI